MSDSGEAFFRADKQNRNEVFSFKNQDPNLVERVLAGDNSARVHPFPQMLGQAQKVGDGGVEPSPPFNDPQPPRT